MVREIITDWTTPAGGGQLSVMYFDEIVALATQRAAIGTMFGAIDARLDNAVVWTVRTSGRTVNPLTGALTGEWNETTAQTGTGALAGQCVPDASQVLLRWNTGSVVGGRFLKGRTFIPGLEVGSVTDGNLSAVATTAIQTAVNNFITAAPGFLIWHRPVGGAGGETREAVSGSVWSELAVLRRRRG